MRIVGLDIGNTSIGWCVIDNGKISGFGARVFPFKQSMDGQTPYKQRLVHRAARRKNKACKQRLEHFAQTLVANGLLPACGRAATVDIRRLTGLAQTEKMTAFQFGAILMFLAKHRGTFGRLKTPPTGREPPRELPMKNVAWQKRDATRLFSKLWRVQSAFMPQLSPGLRRSIAQLLFCRRQPAQQTDAGLYEDPAPERTVNQLKLVLDAISLRYGKPQLIATEMFRLPRNDRIKSSEVGPPLSGQTSRHDELVKRLWLELPEHSHGIRQCIYSGELIHSSDLITNTVEIDHIVPRSRRGSNKFENLLLCTARANREKGHVPVHRVALWQNQMSDILDRAQKLPERKRLRVETGKNPSQTNQYDNKLGHITRKTWRHCAAFLAARFKTTDTKLTVLPGHETAKAREIWDLSVLLQPSNTLDNRHDHRHHAIDAFVLANLAAGAQHKLLGSQVKSELAAKLSGIITSHKVDHGNAAPINLKTENKPATSGQLARETAFGPTRFRDAEGRNLGVIRQSIACQTTPMSIAKVRDQLLREMLMAQLKSRGSNENELQDGMRQFAQLARSKKVRIFEPIINPIKVAAHDGTVLKFLKPGANFRFDVWELPNGKWCSEVVTMANLHDANWQSAIKQHHPTAVKRLKLHHNDCIAVSSAGSIELLRVVKFSANDRLYLAPNNAAGELKARDADKNDPFAYSVRSAAGLKHRMARQVRIDILGQLQDPGFRTKGSNVGSNAKT